LGFVDPRAKLLGKTKTMEQEEEEEEEEVVVVLAQNESLQESFVCLFGYQACQQDETKVCHAAPTSSSGKPYH
jgi:hypothetical protein